MSMLPLFFLWSSLIVSLGYTFLVYCNRVFSLCNFDLTEMCYRTNMMQVQCKRSYIYIELKLFFWHKLDWYSLSWYWHGIPAVSELSGGELFFFFGKGDKIKETTQAKTQ